MDLMFETKKLRSFHFLNELQFIACVEKNTSEHMISLGKTLNEYFPDNGQGIGWVQNSTINAECVGVYNVHSL